MATKQFILQGLTNHTHGTVVSDMFDIPDVQRSIVSVAFITESGVDQIATKLQPHAGSVTVFGGIRNDITSYQGMKRLLDVGVSLYAVDTGTRHLLFHPKLYYVRGKDTARASIGSANLTLGGLNNNIEAGILLDFALNDADDATFVHDLEAQFDALTGAHPANIFQVADVASLDALFATGLLVDEDATPPPRVTTSAKVGTTDTTPRISLLVPRIRKTPKMAVAPALQAPPKPITGTPAAAPVAVPLAPVAPPQPPMAPPVGFQLMWTSKDLEERDLNVPSGTNTNKTGSINLDKGLMAPSVDHRHYFRNNVFAALHWSPKSADVDETKATFELVVKGVYYGKFDLNVRHTTSTTSKSYLQKNAMTRLSWGKAKQYVSKQSLVGRSMSLYRDNANPTLFMIEID